MAPETSKQMSQTIGNYELIEKVAEGGMGTVHKGRHRETGQIVAVKIVPPHMSGNKILLKRFEQEFRAASRLNHPNIVRALDYGDAGNTPYLVMEFVDGESLGQRIERGGKLPAEEAIKLIAQVAQGLHRAHKEGLIHRDVKPDNILVTKDDVAKLADLGLVKEVEADLNLTRTGRGLGTPHFMAPEQFRNAKNADIRCDIYSLGATLYMMVTGELPFRSSGPLDAWMKKVNNELTPPRELVPGLTERLDWAIRRAMSADPEQRPSTCREFVEDLTGHTTRRGSSAEGSIQLQQDLWYLVYKDEFENPHTVKGTTPAIRRSLKEGLLGDATNVRASRVKSGPFEPLRSFPEFRDMVISPAPLAPANVGTSAAAANSAAASASPTSPVVKQPTPTSPPPAIMIKKKEESLKPHISFGAPVEENYEWLKWLLLFIIAGATFLIAFFLLSR